MAWYSDSLFQPGPASIEELFSRIQVNLQNNLNGNEGQIPLSRFPNVFLYYNLQTGAVEVKDGIQNPSITNNYSTLCDNEIKTAIATLCIIAKLQLLVELSKLGDPDINKHIPDGKYDHKGGWQKSFLLVDEVLSQILKLTNSAASNPTHVKVASALNNVGIQNITSLKHVDNILELLRADLNLKPSAPGRPN